MAIMSLRRVFSLLLPAVLISIWATVECQNCASNSICRDCITTPGCAWCAQEGGAFQDMPRCQSADDMSNMCQENYTQNPSSSFISQQAALSNNTINVKEVNLKLRVGDPHTFQIQVTPQPNLPLDLYILIDLSASMSTELQTIKAISSQLASRLSQVTGNIRLGLGSFNDKILRPFSRQPLGGNCPASFTQIPYCPSYAFRHSVNFTDDSGAFAEQVNRTQLTTNADRPENGLEGLAQVITCEEIIGWRERTGGIGSRVILYMTDEEFHIAGEGRYAGLLTPYNGECLLSPNPNGGPVELTRFAEFDYPSVGQILELLRQYDVTTIFAIREAHIQSYQNMEELLNVGSRRAVSAPFNLQGSTDAANEILQLIEREYRRLLQEVSLDFSNVTNILNVEVTANCPAGATQINPSSCDNVELLTSVTFNITVTLNSCDNLENGQTIRSIITSPSFGSFNLSYSVICECDCAEDSTSGPEICSGNGELTCGVCECYPDSNMCGMECNRPRGNRTNLDCPRGGVNNEFCSGRGTCDCVCNCTQPSETGQMIFGNACQCDNFRCEPNPETMLICSGNGMCCEGACVCNRTEEGYVYRGLPGRPNDCPCPPSELVCRDPITGIECNNRGTCDCDFCNCNRDTTFKGRYCDVPNVGVCSYRPDQDCMTQCRRASGERLPDMCTTAACNPKRPVLTFDRAVIEAGNTRINLLSRTNALLGHEPGSPGAFTTVEDQCEYLFDNCMVDYNILSNLTHFVVVMIRELDCSNMPSPLGPLPVWALAPIILGSLIILGILVLILIKVAFLIVDHIEFRKWQSEAKDADFSKNTNPLYQSPEMEYTNVAYGRE